jgi:hypothetical protein
VDRGRVGFIDLVVRFRASDTGVEVGDIALCLKGEIDEVLFYACDAIKTPRPPQRKLRKL